MATASSFHLQGSGVVEARGGEGTTPMGWGAEGSPLSIEESGKGELFGAARTTTAGSTIVQESGREKTGAAERPGKELSKGTTGEYEEAQEDGEDWVKVVKKTGRSREN